MIADACRHRGSPQLAERLVNAPEVVVPGGQADHRGVVPGYRADHPEISWSALAGSRSVLLTQDEGIDPERVWAIVELDLPGLLEAIAALLPPLDQLERELAGEADVPGQEL